MQRAQRFFFWSTHKYWFVTFGSSAKLIGCVHTMQVQDVQYFLLWKMALTQKLYICNLNSHQTHFGFHNMVSKVHIFLIKNTCLKKENSLEHPVANYVISIIGDLWKNLLGKTFPITVHSSFKVCRVQTWWNPNLSWKLSPFWWYLDIAMAKHKSRKSIVVVSIISIWCSDSECIQSLASNYTYAFDSYFCS